MREAVSVFCGSAILVCAVWTAPVRAQSPADPTETEARELFEQGVVAFDAEEHATALVLFERSYALRPSPLVLYNIAVAQRRLGQSREAIASLREYLRIAEPGDGRREMILVELEELEAETREAEEPPPPEDEAPPTLPAVTAENAAPVERAPLPSRRRPEPAEDTTLWESPLTWVLVAAVLLGAGAATWLVLRREPESVEGNFDPPLVMALE